MVTLEPLWEIKIMRDSEFTMTYRKNGGSIFIFALPPYVVLLTAIFKNTPLFQ